MAKMRKTKTQTIVNKIQARVNPEFEKLDQFVQIYDRVFPALQKETSDLGAALAGYDELNKILRDIYQGYKASLGHMAEGGELIHELLDGSANTALLINNLITVFMQGDSGILVQALMELDPPLRRRALSKLPGDLRLKLMIELSENE